MASKGEGGHEGVAEQRPYHHLLRDSRGSLEVFNPSSAASAFRPAAKSTSPLVADRDSSTAEDAVGKAAQRAAEWGLVLQTDEHTGRPQGVAARTPGAGGSARSSSEDKVTGGVALTRVSEELRAAPQQTFVVSDASRLDHPIMYAGAGFFNMTGYTSGSKEVVGRNCRFLQGSGTDPAEIAKIRQALAAGSNYCGRVLDYKKDGTPFWGPPPSRMWMAGSSSSSGQPFFRS